MRDVDVVVLSRFPEIFEGFRELVDRDAPEIRKHVVWDGCKHQHLDEPWMEGCLSSPFKMAHNANFGWQNVTGWALPESRDIVYCGDDTRIIEPDTIKRLQALAYSDPEIGILSPSVDGLCAMEVLPEIPKLPGIVPLAYVGFVFSYIKRDVIDAVGYLDERFDGYGFEDIDYCYRARLAGFKIGVTTEVRIKHGVDGHYYGSTFIRTTGEEEMAKQDAANRKRFAEKWGLDPNDTSGIFAAIRTLSATVAR